MKPIILILALLFYASPALACDTKCDCVQPPVKMTWWQRVKTDPRKRKMWTETVGMFGRSIELMGVGVTLLGKAIQGEV